jgi:competence protein ComEA
MLVDLNGSSRMELEALPGIGMVLADRIVSYRSTYGGFQRVGDLVNVSGIGEKRLKRLEPFVTVEMIAGDIES